MNGAVNLNSPGGSTSTLRVRRDPWPSGSTVDDGGSHLAHPALEHDAARWLVLGDGRRSLRLAHEGLDPEREGGTVPDGSFLGQPRLQDIDVPSRVVPNVRREREDLVRRPAIDVLLSTVIMPFSLLAVRQRFCGGRCHIAAQRASVRVKPTSRIGASATGTLGRANSRGLSARVSEGVPDPLALVFRGDPPAATARSSSSVIANPHDLPHHVRHGRREVVQLA
jgi:hypothetical protein